MDLTPKPTGGRGVLEAGAYEISVEVRARNADAICYAIPVTWDGEWSGKAVMWDHLLVEPPRKVRERRPGRLRHYVVVRPRRRRTLIIAAAFPLEPLAMWLRGYPLGGNLVVRCREGHLFRTPWVPGVSLKALRFGWWRVQRCPVGHHWSVVTPVKESELSQRQRRTADRHRDIRIP